MIADDLGESTESTLPLSPVRQQTSGEGYDIAVDALLSLGHSNFDGASPGEEQLVNDQELFSNIPHGQDASGSATSEGHDRTEAPSCSDGSGLAEGNT